ncbi:MAG: chorismate synthase [Lentisphaeria bacterium]|nr:chorismate synthase [Lentisphaeria bacterium]
MNNTFGELFRITTFGESHGAALGVVIDGVPAGLEIDTEFLSSEMARRRPGQSDVTTARNEADSPEILSGVFEGKATGTPLTILIRNSNQHSSDYSNIKDVYRPGHADYTFEKKYGLRDYRGGGRTSGRETCARVAAGAIAKMLLRKYGISVRACTTQIGSVKTEKTDWSCVENNAVRCADPEAAELMHSEIRSAASRCDSVGGMIYCEILGVPAGFGEPVFDKFDALLAHAMLSIGGVKGFEIGRGFGVAEQYGSGNNDGMTPAGFLSNHAGGILGGISNGNVIHFRIAVKPTPSISIPQQTIDKDGNPVEIKIHGRHDPCLVPRIVPVAEAMAALVTADLLLRNKLSRLDQI